MTIHFEVTRKHLIIAAIALIGAGLGLYFLSRKKPHHEDLAGETRPVIPA